MATAKLYNIARMTTATTGTGTITLGSAVSGFISFATAGVSDAETVTYAIEDGANREIGRGVYTASGTTLTRSVLKSTNAGSAINLSGTAQVFITNAAEDHIQGPSASVDNEIVLYSGTGGATLKRASTTGVLKAASGVIAAAVSGTDYAPATSGSAILKGNGSGGFSSASAGTDYYNPGGTDVALADGGTGASTAAAARANLVIEAKTTPSNDADYTILATDRIISIEWTSISAPRTFTLPAANAVNAGHWITINDRNNKITSSNTLTIARAGSDTIVYGQTGTGTATSLTLDDAANSITLVSDGSGKWTVTSWVQGSPQFTTIELGAASDTTLSRSAAGELAVEGTVVKKVGKETIWVPAAAMTARTTNGAASGSTEMTTNKNMFKTLDYDTTTQEFAQFEVALPKSWNLSTVTFQPIWSHASTSTNFGVVWGLAGVARSDDDAGDVAFGTAQTSTDTGGTTNDIYIGPESSAITIAGTPASGDTVQFQIARNPSDGSDTMAIDARLHGVKLYFTTNASTDA